MKEVFCVSCGNVIEKGFEVNPTNSDECIECQALSKCCGAEVINGRCSDCKENN